MTKGFTLLEVIITLALITILLFFSILSYQTIKKNTVLNNQAEELVNILRVAQNRALTSQGGINHGVHFDINQYIIYGGDWTAPSYQTAYQLSRGLQILAGTGEVIFSRLTGETTAWQITLGYPGSDQKIIQIGAEGNITVN